MEKGMRKVLGVVVAFALTGCATQPKDLVGIKAISANSTLPKSYMMIPLNQEDFNQNSLLYKQVAQVLRQSLSSRGFTFETDPDKASQVIFLDLYRTGAKSSTRNVTVPTWGQTGVSSSTTYGTINSYGNGYGTLSSSTTYTPTYGVTGSYTSQVTDTFYTIIISLKAYDFAKFKQKDKDELWETQIALTSSTPDGLGAYKAIAAYVAPYIDTTLERDAQLYLSPKEYMPLTAK